MEKRVPAEISFEEGKGEMEWQQLTGCGGTCVAGVIRTRRLNNIYPEYTEYL